MPKTHGPENRLAEVEKRLEWMISCHSDFLSQERQHRIIRRRREHALREANPKLPSAAIELLLEGDAEYVVAFTAWQSAQVTRRRAEGDYELARMRAWLSIREVG